MFNFYPLLSVCLLRCIQFKILRYRKCNSNVENKEEDILFVLVTR